MNASDPVCPPSRKHTLQRAACVSVCLSFSRSCGCLMCMCLWVLARHLVNQVLGTAMLRSKSRRQA